MKHEYVSIDQTTKRASWRSVIYLATILVVGLIAIHAFTKNNVETSVGEETEEVSVSYLHPTQITVPDEKPRLFKVGFICEPEQVEFVQHLITNVALLANSNRDVPDGRGQPETFISYEAFASTRPVTNCNQLFLLEAYPNQESQDIHGRAAYKNGLELLQVLRGTRKGNGLPGFSFAKGGLVSTYNCKSDCRAEAKELKLDLIRAEKLKQAKYGTQEREDESDETEDKEFIPAEKLMTSKGGIQGRGIQRTRRKRAVPGTVPSAAKLMTGKAKRAYARESPNSPPGALQPGEGHERVLETHKRGGGDEYNGVLTHGANINARYVKREVEPEVVSVRNAPVQEPENEDKQVVLPGNIPAIIHEKNEKQIIPIMPRQEQEQIQEQPQENRVIYVQPPAPQPQQIVQLHSHQQHHIMYRVTGDAPEYGSPVLSNGE